MHLFCLYLTMPFIPVACSIRYTLRFSETNAAIVYVNLDSSFL